MPMVRSITGLLAIALPICAQPVMQSKTPVTTTAVRDASGGVIDIRNGTDHIVAALVYVYTMRNPDATVLYAATGYYDSATDPAQPQIKPNQTVRIPYRIPFTGAQPVVGVDAILYTDGTTYGERNVVQSIFERRNYTLVSLNKSIGDLKQAAKDGVSRQELISQFQQALAIEASNAGDQELAACIQQVRSQVVAGLITGSRRPDGSPVPVADLIQGQIDALSARRETLRAAIMPR
jgi:hypothetical protein